MSSFSFINSYDDAWKAIIMPPRQEYEISNLGAREFNVRNNRIHRTDLQLVNKHGNALHCSFYQQVDIKTACPCVVYLHANGSSRLEAVQHANIVLGYPVSFFSFDFTGCGKSEGIYSSVGWFEQDDLDCIIQYLESSGKVNKICLWGRSMGATTALLYSAKYLKAECLILDSPFASFKKLVKEIVKKKTSIPSFLTNGAFSMIRKTISSKANFDIDDLRPIRHLKGITVPALFGVARGDSYVSPQHTQDLYTAYLGEKKIEYFDGDHNSGRSIAWLRSVQDFIVKNLLSEKSNLPEKNGLVKNPSTIPSLQIKGMKFTWLDSSPPSGRSKLSQDLTLSKKTSKGSQGDNNGECLSSRQRFRGVSVTATSYRFMGEDTGTTTLQKNASRHNLGSSVDLKTDHDDPQEDTYVKPQLMWQCDHQKTNLGPKLVSSRPGEEMIMQGKMPAHSLYSHQTSFNGEDLGSKNVNVYKYSSHNNSFNLSNFEPDVKNVKNVHNGSFSVQNSVYGRAYTGTEMSTEMPSPGSFVSPRQEKANSHRGVNKSKTFFKGVEKLSTPQPSSRIIQLKFDPNSPVFLQNPRISYPSRNDYGKPLSPNDSFYSPNSSKLYSDFPPAFSPKETKKEISFKAEQRERPTISIAEPKLGGYSIYEGYGLNKKRISLDNVLHSHKSSYGKGY